MKFDRREHHSEVDASDAMNKFKAKVRDTEGLPSDHSDLSFRESSVRMIEDKTSLTDLAKNCVTRMPNGVCARIFAQKEQLALADDINILNYDDALELFSRHSRSSRCSR